LRDRGRVVHIHVEKCYATRAEVCDFVLGAGGCDDLEACGS
jgi:hypothetical protein